MNGCIGISYIRQLRQRTRNRHQPSRCHFGPQMIPGLDLISTLFILIKYRKVNLDVKAGEPNSVTMQSPYTAPSPYAYKTAPATEPKIYKRHKKHKKLLFLIYMTFGILFYFKSEIVESVGKKYEEITAEETTFYEMTDEETALIQNFSRDAEGKEKVAAGQLTSFQAELLENLRIGYSYIEDKYRMKFSTNPDSVVEDNLYAYSQEDSFFQYIEEQLAGEVPGVAKLDTDEWYGWYITEYENPDDLTVQEILVNDLNPSGAISAFSIHGNLPEDSP